MTEDELYEGFKDFPLDDLNYSLSNACEIGKLYVVKFLLTSPRLKVNAEINHNKSVALRVACQKGHLDIVKYLLSSPDLKQYADIHANNDEPILFAAFHGYLDIVKYLMTSNEIQNHAKIVDNKINALSFACSGGHIDIVDFFLHSKELKEKIDIHMADDAAFRQACVHEQNEMLHYLIFDCFIKKTEQIDKYLKESNNQQVQSMFKTRELRTDLAQNLNNDLNLNNQKQPQNKIKI
jgi:ankyrin repeat protein